MSSETAVQEFDRIAAIPTGRYDGDEFEIVGLAGDRETRLDVILGWAEADEAVEALVAEHTLSPEEIPEACTWSRQEAARVRLRVISLCQAEAARAGAMDRLMELDAEERELEQWLAGLYNGTEAR